MRRDPSNRVERSAINTDKFIEEKRQDMCRTAVETLSTTKVKFFEHIKTEENKLYALNVELDEEMKGSRSNIFVQAFKCSTEPPLFLHVSHEVSGFIVWIIAEESKPILMIDDLDYDVKIVKNVSESKYR